MVTARSNFHDIRFQFENNLIQTHRSMPCQVPVESHHESRILLLTQYIMR